MPGGPMCMNIVVDIPLEPLHSFISANLELDGSKLLDTFVARLMLQVNYIERDDTRDPKRSWRTRYDECWAGGCTEEGEDGASV